MLSISTTQMASFEARARRGFEDDMVAHMKAFSPALCKVLGDEQVRVAVVSAMSRASSHGFNFKGPVRLYLEMSFLRGSAFDTDPQFHAVQQALNAPLDQMIRADRMHMEFSDYLVRVSGPNASNVLKALNHLDYLARVPFTLQGNDFVSAIRLELERAFPQKVAYIGQPALEALIYAGMEAARACQFSKAREAALMVVLMFAFGHGCTSDPLYPWIGRTLGDQRIVNAGKRAERLERKSLTWLEHVLARPAAGETR